MNNEENSLSTVILTGTANADFNENNTEDTGDTEDTEDTEESIPAGAIVNYKTNVTVNGTERADFIVNYEDNVRINCESGDDSVKNYGSSVTISGGAGSDSIFSEGNKNFYRFAKNEGNDTVIGFADGDTLQISSGSISKISINGQDVILSVGSKSSITFKDAKNKTFIIKPTSGDAYSTVFSGAATILSIKNSVLTVSQKFMEDQIDLAEYPEVTNLNASAVAQGISIIGTDENNSIRGGKGSDTIIGNGGNDTISLGGGADIYIYTSGNDVITDYKSGEDTINLQNFAITGSSLSGSDVVLQLSSGGTVAEMTLKKAKGKTVTTLDSKGNEYSQRYGYYYYNFNRTQITLNSDFNDTLYNTEYSSSVRKIDASEVLKKFRLYGNAQSNTITAGKGTAYIFAGDGKDYISGGEGNDSLFGEDGNDSISGNVGNDHINGGKGADTLLGGYGNDAIYGSEGNDYITGGIGNDSLYGGDDNDTLYGNEGNDYLLGNIGNDKLYGEDGNDTLLGDYGNDFLFGDTGNDKLWGDDGNDTLNGGAGDDTLTGGDGKDIFIYKVGEGNDVIADFIPVDDKISISGNASISSEGLKGTKMIFKIGTNTLTFNDAQNKEIAMGDLYYYNNLICNSKKTEATLNSNFSGTLTATNYYSQVKNIYATDMTKAVQIYGNSSNNYIDGGKSNDSLFGGLGNDTLIGNKGNDKLYGEDGNDSILGGEGNDTLYGGEGNDTFVVYAGGGDDVIADFAEGDLITLTSGSVSSYTLKNLDMVFTIGTNLLTVKNGGNHEIAIGDKFYYGNFIYDSSKKTATFGTSFTGTIKSTDYPTSIRTIDLKNFVKGVTIYGNEQNNSIYGGAGNDTFYGKTGNDYLEGNDGNDLLCGDGGKDTLDGGKGNDTLYGGSANDVFIYNSGEGNDVIADYAPGDKIILNKTSVSSAVLSDSDMVFTVGKNTLTLKDSKDKEISIEFKSRNSSNIYYNNFIYDSTKTSATLQAAGTYNRNDYASSITKIDASALSKSVTLSGNTATNIIGGTGNDSLKSYSGKSTIFGGNGNDYVGGGLGNDSLSGGAGSDTLYGTTGSDTLTGGAGKDLFWQHSGKNTITDYTAGEDKIQFDANVTKIDYTFTDVIFYFNKDSLTVQNGRGKKITTINANGETSTETYSPSNNFTLDLLYDDNFVTDEFEIDDITEENFDVTEIQTVETENFAQDDATLSYGENEKIFV